MQEHLKESFAYWRARGTRASVALERARQDVASGTRRYGACKPAIVYNPRCTVAGFNNVRWVENASNGMRLVGFADMVASRRAIDHTGWFTDDDQSGDLYRGVVYQLPAARHGAKPECSWSDSDGERNRYAYGYADPNNDGAALLCFDLVADRKDAARFADQLAERRAESERDYQRAWRAGTEHAELGETIKAARRRCLALIREARAACKRLADAPMIRDTIRAAIEAARETIEECRAKRAELESEYRRGDALDAFKEGAQEGGL
jgi:hypothetical protein